jgi:hypothetical protein
MASSYDRTSTTEGLDSWFGNLDFGHYLRVEQNQGRTEHVLADLRGPGVVTRIFSPNAGGTVRLYFDGESTPRVTEEFAWFLSGNADPFRSPLGDAPPDSFHLNYPIPYGQSLKITVEERDLERLRKYYYCISYRTYPPGTRVETWSYEVAGRARPEFERTKQILENPSLLNAGRNLTSRRGRATSIPGSNVTLLNETGSGAIYEFRLKFRPITFSWSHTPTSWDQPERLHNLLRRHILSIFFDDELCVRMPIGDFAATIFEWSPYRTFPMEVTADGTIVCRFVMPFARSFRVDVLNLGGGLADIEVEALTGAFDRLADRYLFRAQYRGFREWTRPRRDFDVLTAFGEGLLLGSTLHVANPTTIWWGEGDEKVWVDGESFPSTFGTGTEDYFGFGWFSNERFSRPFHAQSYTTGRENLGHATMCRWHVTDPIPFRRSIRFAIEMWHLVEALTDFHFGAFWYATPGSTPPTEFARGLLDPRFID